METKVEDEMETTIGSGFRIYDSRGVGTRGLCLSRQYFPERAVPYARG